MCKLNHPVFSTNINCCRENVSDLWAIGWEPSRTVCPPTQLAKSFDGNAVDVLEDHVDDVEDAHLGLHHLRIHLEHVHQHLLAEAHHHRGRLQKQSWQSRENLSAAKGRLICILGKPSTVWGWPRRKQLPGHGFGWIFHR